MTDEEKPSPPAKPEPAPDAPDPSMRLAVMTVAGTALALAVLAALGFGPSAGFGAAVGGSLATANLAFFARLVAAFLTQRGHTAPWAVLGVIKLVGLFAVAWIVLKSDMVPAIWFAVGYASLPLGVTLSTLLRKPPPDPGEKAS